MPRESSDVLRGSIDLLILRTLSAQPMHGWGISQVIRETSKGVLDVNHGSLYPALQRLEQREWIDGEWRNSENNRRARYYHITAKGRRAIGEEIRSWRRFAAAVELVLKAAPAGVLLAATLATASLAQAPEVISPRAIAARGLPVRNDTVDFLVGDREHGEFQGYYAYAVSHAKVGGRSGYLVTMNHRSPGSGNHFQSDTLALDSATLAPVWHRYHAWDDSAVVTFTGRHASGWSLRNGHHTTVDFTLTDLAFDATVSRWLLPMVTLAPDAQAAITTFSIWSNDEHTTRLSVGERELVPMRGRKVEAWVLSSPDGRRHWVARDEGVVQELEPGGRGRGFWLVRR